VGASRGISRQGAVIRMGCGALRSDGSRSLILALGVLRPAHVLLLALTVLARPAFAWEPLTESREQQELLAWANSSGSRGAADSLTPGGGQFEFESEAGSHDCVAGYEIQPSFEPFGGWCLLESDGRWILRSYVADKALDDGPRFQFVANPDVVLDAATAAAIRAVWLNAILDSRYPRFFMSGLDGDLHVFRARRYKDYEPLWAQVWSPEADLPPRWLADAGGTILDYGSGKTWSPDDLASYMFALRDKLFEYYRTRQK
jgi:hypothetical protein